MSVLSRLGVAASQLDFTVKQFLRTLMAVNTVAAAGSSEADAAAITTGKVLVTAADGTKGVILPVAEVDMSIEVVNTVSDQDLKVYPNTGAQINALTATTGAFTLGAGQAAVFYCDAALHWYVRAASIVTGVATDATTAELNMAADNSANVEIVAATNVIAAAESGKTFFLNHATEFVSTLPAPAAGLRFTFIVTGAPSGASYTIVTDSAAQVIFGHNLASDGNAADVEATGGATTITFVDGQSVVGDRVDVISDGTNWYARGTSAVPAGITITG